VAIGACEQGRSALPHDVAYPVSVAGGMDVLRTPQHPVPRFGRSLALRCKLPGVVALHGLESRPQPRERGGGNGAGVAARSQNLQAEIGTKDGETQYLRFEGWDLGVEISDLRFQI